MGRRVPDGGVVLHDVKGQVPGPLFDILSHSYHPAAFTRHNLCAGDMVLEPGRGGIADNDMLTDPVELSKEAETAIIVTKRCRVWKRG